MKAELICMVDRFPVLKDKILSLFERDEEFQALCYDYFLCVTSMDRWERSMQNDKMFIQEYGDLKSTLEDDLIKFIQKHDSYAS
jgi:hypothetical protein